LENGHRFLPDWEEGQKTGFFLDQRENRALLESMADGARVLNLFSYSGGFSIAALCGGATLVHSVDSSKRAIDLLHKNIALNACGNNHHEAFVTDAFDFLKASQKGVYNLMVLDPPAFAKHTHAKGNALQAYKRLNAIAFDRIAPCGIIFTFSCSQVVDKNDFALAVFSAAAISGRKVRILHRLGQAPDHPVNIYHPEGDYLKGLVLFVE
jgi:23S rRNA (cytosine1962-C5)-methyltransferase